MPSYTVTRGRNGRFNFTLLTERGRISGSVAIAIQAGQSREELNEAVRQAIATLTGQLVEASEGRRTGRAGNREPQPDQEVRITAPRD